MYRYSRFKGLIQTPTKKRNNLMAKKRYEGLYELYHLKMMAMLAEELECSQNEVLREALDAFFIKHCGNKKYRELVNE